MGQASESGRSQHIEHLIPAMRAFARTLCPQSADADDLVQETLERGLANIHQYRDGTRMKSWLFTIMRNAFYDRVKRGRREVTGDADCVSTQPSRAATQDWTVRGGEIAAAIERLPLNYREVLVLVGVLGESYEEASAICGCSIGTIKSRMNRARARLLAELHEETAASSLQENNTHSVIPLHAGRRSGAWS